MKKRILDCQFLKFMNNTLLFSFCLLVLMSCTPTEKTLQEKSTSFYVGTYTDGDSQGIYQYSISKEGKLIEIGLAAATENPSFLAKTKDGKTVLAVSEVNHNGSGFVKAYAVKKDTLIFKSESNSGGAHPCFITVNQNNDVLVANYSGGNVGLLQLNQDQDLVTLQDVQQHFGKGTTPRQEAPHAHSAWFHPKTNEVLALDLGTNQIWWSHLATKDQKLEWSTPQTFDMEIGAGPRHLSFHPNKEWMYVLNELNNTVALLKKRNEVYEIAQTISTLPSDFEKYSKAADIHISNDGKFLYASNRGHNSIVIYSVQENGKLKLVDFQEVLGENPRNFSLALNDNFLVVANQDSNMIISFKRNTTNGKLEVVDKIKSYSPVCLLF